MRPLVVLGGLFLATTAVWFSSRAPTGSSPASPSTGEPPAAPPPVATSSSKVEPALPTSPASSAECATGCAVGNHPIEPLSADDYRSALRGLAAGGSDERARALETLLFHGTRTSELMERLGTGRLDGEDAALLRRELSRTHARLSLRLVDESGTVRARVDRARFPIGVKEHVHATGSVDLPAPEVSGTVHRTAPHHLWTRL